ncbi:MAG: nucleotidyltransferase [marine bacterium B5-7]|nr:MAG: nucleotidyltransferase [marine bacterium B5-7]
MKTVILDNLDISALLKAQATLSEFYNNTKTEQEMAGTIHAFEFAYELAWKTMKRILTKRGLEVLSPKVTFRTAAKEGLITDVEQWFEFVEMRNLTVHTYNQDNAQAIFDKLPGFIETLNLFVETIKIL